MFGVMLEIKNIDDFFGEENFEKNNLLDLLAPFFSRAWHPSECCSFVYPLLLHHHLE